MGRELNIEELAERWELLRWQYGIDSFKVQEKFSKRELHNFIVNGLSMDICNEIVVCSDYDDILIQNYCVLMMFLKEHLSTILLIPITGGFQERLEFTDGGLILIEKAS